MRQCRGPRVFVPRSAVVLWTIAWFVHTTVAGCNVDRKDAPTPGAELPPTAKVSTTEDGPVEGADDSADGSSDSAVAATEGCRSEGSDDPELPHAELVEVRRSNIPTAGEGLFASSDIAADTYLGDYMGQYLTEPEVEVLPEYESAYLFELPRHARTTYGSIAGDPLHYVSKVNFAPSEINGEDTNLQNIEWEIFCDEPYVRLYSTREITAGEELYVDYGPSYGYEFMAHPRVQEFFLALIGTTSEEGFVFEYSRGS